MKLFVSGAIGIVIGILFATLAGIVGTKSKPPASTHYVACLGFTRPLPVWGDPKPNGPYLSVKLSPDGEWRLIGPNCGIIPNPENM